MSKKLRKIRNIFVFTFISVILGISLLFIFLNSRLMPSVMEIARIYAQNRVNHAINDALQQFVEYNTLESADFYEAGTMPSGFTINTVLVNQICARLAVDISDSLAARRNEVIPIPLGMAAGIEMIAALGPSVGVRVVPMGDAVVDFETSFTSVGINQVNFQIWLKIESTVGLVTPLQYRRITMTRRVALVDTVYSGEIPQFYVAPRYSSPE